MRGKNSWRNFGPAWWKVEGIVWARFLVCEITLGEKNTAAAYPPGFSTGGPSVYRGIQSLGSGSDERMLRRLVGPGEIRGFQG